MKHSSLSALLVVFFVALFSTTHVQASPEAGGPKLLQHFSFSPVVTLWLCPKGARYVLLECKPTESVLPKAEFPLAQVTEDTKFFQGYWESQTPDKQIFTSVTVSSLIHEKEGPVLYINVGAGFEIDDARHAGVFLDVPQSGIPNQIMITGDRRAISDTQEVVITLEMNEIAAH